MKNIHSFPIDKEDGGARIDVFLASRLDPLSRAQIQKAIAGGHVRLNSLPAKAGQRLREGDQLVFEQPPVAAYDVAAENIPLNVVYEDAFLLVIDKPAGLVVHPAAGNYQGTLVHALLFHCRDLSGIGGVMRPGIVHRLDKGTSGLLVVAKSDAAHQGLAEQFKRHEVKKTYQALVYGDVKGEEGIIDAPVGRDTVDRKKMSTRTRRGKEARTCWRVGERYGGITLLQVDIETGRTHQIRVHLHHAGHPIVGDAVYGGASRVKTLLDPLLKEKIKALTRPALHSFLLSFIHPVTARPMNFSSPLPEDISTLCDFLRGDTAHPSKGTGRTVTI